MQSIIKVEVSKTISILGCGWLGKALAIDLITNNYVVKGSTTSDQKLQELSNEKIIPHLIDISHLPNDILNFLDSEILLIAITSKNVEDFEKLSTVIEKSSIKKVIFISSTSVYPSNNETVTEDSPTLNTALSQIEDIFRSNTNFQSTIIRFGGLFGYNRKPGNFIKPNKPFKNPEGFINLIHRDDCIGIIKSIIENDIWNETFNACANDHPIRREFYTKEALKLGKNNIEFEENSKNEYKIVNSDKVINRTGYQFKYADLMKF